MSKVAFVASDLKQNNHLKQVWFGDQLFQDIISVKYIRSCNWYSGRLCFHHLDANEILHINE